jgi:hypothetical protein
MGRLASLALIALVAACATESNRPASIRPGSVLIGRVVGSEEVHSFIGDVEVVWYSHAIEPRDGAGTRLVVLSTGDDCPALGNNTTLYRMSLRQRSGTEVVRFRQDRDRDFMNRWMSDLVISSCEIMELR